MSNISCELPLPSDFRAIDALSFHRRDPLQVAEKVGPDQLSKGLLWGGLPACLTLHFAVGKVRIEWAVDGGEASPSTANALCRRILGLDQPVAPFAERFSAHPQLGPLLAHQPGLRVPQTATPFEALTWAVTGQQISVGAAVSLRRKLILAAGQQHSCGIACYPDAPAVLAVGEAGLRAAGFSGSKTRTLLDLSEKVLAGHLPLDDWLSDLPVDRARESLLAVRGVGPWTVNYTLLRGFAWLDGSLHGDAAVRRALQTLLGQTDKLDEETTRRWLAGFSPWRALVAAHLWASGGVVA